MSSSLLRLLPYALIVILLSGCGSSSDEDRLDVLSENIISVLLSQQASQETEGRRLLLRSENQGRRVEAVLEPIAFDPSWISSIQWDWGDGSQSQGLSLSESHIYSQPGDYTLAVTIRIQGEADRHKQLNLSLENAAPQALTLSAEAAGGQPLEIPLEALDPEDDPLTFGPSAGSGDQGGSFVIEGDVLVYTPLSSFAGIERVVYQVSDGFVEVSQELSIQVLNQPPLAEDQDLTLAKNSADNPITLIASDANDDPLSFFLEDESSEEGGSLELGEGGVVSYTPPLGFDGTDSFRFRAFDGSDYSAWATVSISIPNQIPLAENQSLTLEKNSTDNQVSLGASDADGDPLSFFLEDESSEEGGSLELGEEGAVSYTPPFGFDGTDSFRFRVFDGSDYSEWATVSISIPNQPPLAENQTISLLKRQSISIQLSASDPDGDALTYSLPQASSDQGQPLSIDGDRVTYTAGSSSGSDRFTFTVDDGSETATGEIILLILNSPPMAQDISVSVSGGGAEPPSTAIQLVATDADGDSLHFQLRDATSVNGGSLVLTDSDTGIVSYTPPAGFTGLDVFYYEALDEEGALSAPASVFVMVSRFRVPAMVRLPGGSFDMGGQNEADREVVLDEFLIATTPITTAQYVDMLNWLLEEESSAIAVAPVNGHPRLVIPGSQVVLYDLSHQHAQIEWDAGENLFQVKEVDGLPNDEADRSDHPLVLVTWRGALLFAWAMNRQEGLTAESFDNWQPDLMAAGYRLPTEAEWEYAAKDAGKEQLYPWGNTTEDLDDRSNFWSSGDEYEGLGFPETTPVQHYDPTPDWGLYDLAGNAYDWCHDWFTSDLPTGVFINPTGPNSGEQRVRRGGAWNTIDPEQLTTEYRAQLPPSLVSIDTGFRIVRSEGLAPGSDQ